MKARLLLALLAAVLTTAACGESITAPTPETNRATVSGDTASLNEDGPLWGSGNRS